MRLLAVYQEVLSRSTLRRLHADSCFLSLIERIDKKESGSGRVRSFWSSTALISLLYDYHQPIEPLRVLLWCILSVSDKCQIARGISRSDHSQTMPEMDDLLWTVDDTGTNNLEIFDACN